MKIHGTAKGGAIGKKDFGVAFSGVAPEPSGTTYTQTTVSSETGISGSGDNIKGEMCKSGTSLLIGQILDAQFYLKRTGEDASTITCGVFANDSTLLHTFWTMDFNSVDTSLTLTDESSTATTSDTVHTNVIGIRYTGSGDLKFGYAAAKLFDDNNSTYSNRDAGTGTLNGIDNVDSGFKIKVAD